MKAPGVPPLKPRRNDSQWDRRQQELIALHDAIREACLKAQCFLDEHRERPEVRRVKRGGAVVRRTHRT
jgi:hypothetical protein